MVACGALQEVVIIGLGMDEASVRAQFDKCLLTEAEMAQEMPGNVWPLLPDPWPSWDEDEEDE
jgi:hypothetical protein